MKGYASSKPTGYGKTSLSEVFVHTSGCREETKKSVTTYFALGCIEGVYQVSARLTELSRRQELRRFERFQVFFQSPEGTFQKNQLLHAPLNPRIGDKSQKK